jgi:hypothetical protein
MTAFAITFSERYRTEVHPLDGDVNPEGYVRVEAKSVSDAEVIAYRNFNAYFDAVVPEAELNAEEYPLGCLYSI